MISGKWLSDEYLMSFDKNTPSIPATEMPRWPWICLAVGMISALGSVCLRWLVPNDQPSPGYLDGLRFLLVFLSYLFAGSSVYRGLQSLQGDYHSRIQIASLTGVSSLVPMIGWFAFGNDWDSGQMVSVGLCILGFGGAILIALPLNLRKVVITLLVVFHFGGIATAILSPAPPGQNASWLAIQSWVRVYRPYLTFMYLNNAYHFYSPEPGPATLIWCYIIYSRGEGPERERWGEWVKFPLKDKSPVPIHYLRLISLGMGIEGVVQYIPETQLQDRASSRRLAGNRLGIPLQDDSIPLNLQYRIPLENSQFLLSAFARHLARTHPHRPDKPDYHFEGVKIYRVTHGNMLPNQMMVSENPTDRKFYFPYFQGEYDASGKLADPNDPFLYWLIPAGEGVSNRDYLEEHARAGTTRS